MKGGKAGRGRNASNARYGKAKARAAAKTGGPKRAVGKADAGKVLKKTTRLGAVRKPDDD